MNLPSKISAFMAEPLMEKTETLSHWYWLLKTQFYYRCFFKHIGHGSRILKPLRMKNVASITLGERVLVHKYCWLQTQIISGTIPNLTIGDGCVIGNFNHITCTQEVRIEEHVLTADRVFITDHSHQYEDTALPIISQGLVQGGPVTIGSGTWLGENVAVLSCNIGKHCVIGANSVVIHDVPDYSVAAGIPARVIRQYNLTSKTWESVRSGQA